jgi:hypothetical protein
MEKTDFISVIGASILGGVLKVLKSGKLSWRRWITELIGAIIIGFSVFNVLQEYTSVPNDLAISAVAISAVLWTHILDMTKDYITKKFKENE